MTEQADQKRTARIVHHKDGKRSIKRLGPKPVVSTVKHQPTTPEQRAAREPQFLKRTPQPKRRMVRGENAVEFLTRRVNQMQVQRHFDEDFDALMIERIGEWIRELAS